MACQDHGVAWLTEKLRPALAGADYIHVSNEVSFLPSCSYGGDHPYQFCSRPVEFQALDDLHVNVVELTGNHNRDFGDAPFRATYRWYAEHGMATFGAGLDPEAANTPIILPLADGKRLGIIGFNEWCPLHECAKAPGEVGANAYSDDKAFADLAALRTAYGADIVMATVQFHESEHHKPLDSQARIARALVDHGADIVSGSQAHQLQWVEFYKGKPIYFGIGNFLFDQVYKDEVRQAFFVHHYFFAGRLVQSVPVFTYMAADRQPTLATPAQAAAEKGIAYRDELLYTP
jgi:poly-gamma-glutamate synthesis protein (capsule biosynthesis protein)